MADTATLEALRFLLDGRHLFGELLLDHIGLREATILLETSNLLALLLPGSGQYFHSVLLRELFTREYIILAYLDSVGMFSSSAYSSNRGKSSSASKADVEDRLRFFRFALKSGKHDRIEEVTVFRSSAPWHLAATMAL